MYSTGNGSVSEFQSYLYGIEIVDASADASYTDSFNRTFMELKCVSVVSLKDNRDVSIVPLWN